MTKDSIGSNAERHKNYSIGYGVKVPTTEQTTSLNATQLTCTKKKEAATSLQQLDMNKLLARVCLIISSRESYPSRINKEHITYLHT